jgi:hypothetical protein
MIAFDHSVIRRIAEKEIARDKSARIEWIFANLRMLRKECAKHSFCGTHIYRIEGKQTMSSTPIFFEFQQEKDALLALDTLEELGYSPNLLTHAERPTLHIHVDDQDLTSALEITQAHAGKLVEKKESYSEPAAFAMAYDLEDSIRIPAHVVNEDWADDYASPAAHQIGDAILNEEEPVFDPSTDDYDHFSPGVHI